MSLLFIELDPEEVAEVLQCLLLVGQHVVLVYLFDVVELILKPVEHDFRVPL